MKTEQRDRCWCGHEYEQSIEVVVPETEIERLYLEEYIKFNLNDICRCKICNLGVPIKIEKEGEK